MRIIISPAKKMKADTDSFPSRDLPVFISRTEQIQARMREMSFLDLKALWKCNDKIAELNARRLRDMNLKSNLTPAILAYEGIQYRYMEPRTFTEQNLSYVQEHLRILSGFYGILRPLDGVTPYRLEIKAKLHMGEAKDLYAFWSDSIAKSLFSETNCIINLASKEYSRCVSDHLTQDVEFITCAFCERKDGKLVEKGTLCKMARGEMACYVAQNQIDQPERLKNFDRLGYRFSPENSDSKTYTFIKEDM